MKNRGPSAGKQRLCAVFVLAASAMGCHMTSPPSDCEEMWDYWRPKVIAAAATNKPLILVPGESVGPVSLGMAAEDVRAALGPAERVAFGAWEYPTLGLAFSFKNDHVEGISGGSGTCGDPERLLSKAFPGRLGGRVGMGATRQEIVEVLGEPSSSYTSTELPVEMLFYPGMELALEAGRWGWMRMYRPTR
jgi:hypothetical protein